MKTDEQGRKDDQEKLRYDLIPVELNAAVAAVLGYGAAKYEERNWERGMKWSRPYGALKRHVDAWWGGEPNDPGTEMPHLWHAACCVTFLLAYEARHTGHDDRPLAYAPRGGRNPGPYQKAMQQAISRLRPPPQPPMPVGTATTAEPAGKPFAIDAWREYGGKAERDYERG